MIPVGAAHLQASLPPGRRLLNTTVTDDVLEIIATSPMLSTQSAISFHWIRLRKVVP